MFLLSAQTPLNKYGERMYGMFITPVYSFFFLKGIDKIAWKVVFNTCKNYCKNEHKEI